VDTGDKADGILNCFRTTNNPRIVVTVDMIATGTDVGPLEILFFLRDVLSLNYFEQMKGRGVRVLSSDELRGVTPDAETKDRFVIVDAHPHPSLTSRHRQTAHILTAELNSKQPHKKESGDDADRQTLGSAR
jgi:type I site-specific restriction endonuclease